MDQKADRLDCVLCEGSHEIIIKLSARLDPPIWRFCQRILPGLFRLLAEFSCVWLYDWGPPFLAGYQWGSLSVPKDHSLVFSSGLLRLQARGSMWTSTHVPAWAPASQHCIQSQERWNLISAFFSKMPKPQSPPSSLRKPSVPPTAVPWKRVWFTSSSSLWPTQMRTNSILTSNIPWLILKLLAVSGHVYFSSQEKQVSALLLEKKHLNKMCKNLSKLLIVYTSFFPSAGEQIKSQFCQVLRPSTHLGTPSP